MKLKLSGSLKPYTMRVRTRILVLVDSSSAMYSHVRSTGHRIRGQDSSPDVATPDPGELRGAMKWKSSVQKVLESLGYRLQKVHIERQLPAEFASASLDPPRERRGLPKAITQPIQAASLDYSCKGTRCIKSPFDMALYLKLLLEVRPRTIIEIGSASGGSALWLADQVRAFGLEAKIYSLDIEPPMGVSDPLVPFLKGGVHRLEDSDLPDILANMERPLLVIKDGPTARVSSAPSMSLMIHLQAGEYLIVEDGIVNDLEQESYRNGPNRAIATSLGNHEYVMDYSYCDFFGPNFTWNTNGYFRSSSWTGMGSALDSGLNRDRSWASGGGRSVAQLRSRGVRTHR